MFLFTSSLHNFYALRTTRGSCWEPSIFGDTPSLGQLYTQSYSVKSSLTVFSLSARSVYDRETKEDCILTKQLIPRPPEEAVSETGSPQWKWTPPHYKLQIQTSPEGEIPESEILDQKAKLLLMLFIAELLSRKAVQRKSPPWEAQQSRPAEEAKEGGGQELPETGPICHVQSLFSMPEAGSQQELPALKTFTVRSRGQGTVSKKILVS